MTEQAENPNKAESDLGTEGKVYLEFRSQYIVIIALFYLIEGMNFSIFAIIVPIYILTTAGTLEASVFGMLAGFIMTPWMIKFVFGVLSDKANFQKYGRRKPWVIVCGSLGGLLWVLIPTILAGFPTDPVLIFSIVGMIIAFGIAIGDTNVDGLILDICPSDKLGRVQGICFAAKSAGTVVGGPLIAVLTYSIAPEAIFVAFGILIIASSCLTALIRENPMPQKTDLWKTVKEMVKNRKNWRIFLYGFTSSLTNGVVGTYIALYVLIQIGLVQAEGATIEIFEGNLDLYVPQANISLLIGAGIFIGALVGGTLADKKSRQKSAYLGFAISIVSFLLLPLPFGIVFLIPAVIIVGYGQGNRDSVHSAILSEVAIRRYPDTDITFYSIGNSFGNMGLTIGLVAISRLFPFIAGYTNDTNLIYLIVFVVFALMSAVALLIFPFIKPDEYNLRK